MFHSDWDNFDQLVSNVYGARSVHTTVGIYMQDLGFSEGDDAQELCKVHQSQIKISTLRKNRDNSKVQFKSYRSAITLSDLNQPSLPLLVTNRAKLKTQRNHILTSFGLLLDK